MKDIPVADVRNIVLVGHTGSGKTSLVDAILYKMGCNDRLGLVAQGSSMADWTDEEKERKLTIWAKPFQGAYASKDGRKVGLTLIDTPGYADFYGQLVAGSAIADAALVVIDAASGIQVGTTRAWRRCEALGLPRGIVITGLDKENVSFDDSLKAIQELWGRKCVPVELPTKDRHAIIDILASQQVPPELSEEAEKDKNILEEDAAEEDDKLLDKYLGGDHLTPEELTRGLRLAIARGHLIPVFETEALQGVGVPELLEEIARLFPSPVDIGAKAEDGTAIDVGAGAPFSARVWRSVNDPHVGQLSYLRVMSGTLKSDSEIFNATKEQKERSGPLHVFNGKKDEVVPEVRAGDIVSLAKLKFTSTNDTLCAPGKSIKYEKIKFPNPVMALAIAPKTPGDDDKIGVGLQRVCEEDPTLRVERNTETKEMILAGMGDIHLDVAVTRMKKRSNVDVVLNTPKVSYKETITSKAEGHYKHKKQSGGRGQYGEVYLRVEPLRQTDEPWFVDALVGTSIPRNFLPAIEKGLVEGMSRGALAGYPVVNAKVTVYDGSYHDVDSSEIAFKIAGARAFSEGMIKAKPVLLEPILTVKIVVPDRYMGDITGDLNHRRGRILGVGSEDGMQAITAEVPQAEMFRYASELRSITHGQGSFESTFARYDVVPGNVAQKVIAEAQKKMHPVED
ncbi:MAG TPA: elongation factor G [Kiritimatiellia bacterium]